MELNVTFDCECSGFVDKNIQINDSELEAGHVFYEQLICDSCTKDYEAAIETNNGKIRVRIPGSFNLGFENVSIDDSWAPLSDEELSWVIQSTAQLGTFQGIMTDVVALLRADVRIPNMSTLYNMAYAQVVTAVEAYLSGIFIHKVVNSEILMRKLVETDPELAKRQLSLKEIFARQDGLQLEVARYLQDLIFHDLKKINKMYQSVLGVDFGEIPWLYRAVQLRHDCVHRNGVDKNGRATGIDNDVIEVLIRECVALIVRIDEEVTAATLIDAEGNL